MVLDMADKCKQEANVEIQVVIDKGGVKCIRIVGPAESHESGHRLYFELQDLIVNLDEAIQIRATEKENNGRLSWDA